jgi:hypothetical protein
VFGGHRAQLGARLLFAVHEQRRHQGDGEQEVGDRAGGDDGDALPDVLAREVARQVGFVVGAVAGSRLSSICT